MIVWIVINYNLYESKRHFSQKLADSFERRGIKVHLIDLQKGPPGSVIEKQKLALDFPPDLCCSFNRVIPDRQGAFFWDLQKIPYLSLLLDPAIYDLNLIRSPTGAISCVDENDCELLESKGFKRAFFWPHGVERELAEVDDHKKVYDVVMFGSCYDPEGLRNAWRQKYPPPIQTLIEEAAEMTLEGETPFWVAVQRTIERLRFDPMEIDFRKICTLVDNFVRGVDRLELIRSVAKIPGIKVHLFGGSCWREETPILGWGHYFKGSSQVEVHGALPFTEALEVMKSSRVCLNSSIFFKKGSHERILIGLACGSLVVTSESTWTRREFEDSLLIYKPKQWQEVNDKIHYLLTHEEERKEMITKGREKVLQGHTWDTRVEQLLKQWNLVRRDEQGSKL